MIDQKTLKSLEYDKVLTKISDFAVLKRTKRIICDLKPSTDKQTVEIQLNKTSEAFKLLFTYGVSGVEFFDDITDEPERAKKGATLNMAELLRVSRLLKSSRIVSNGILSVTDESIKLIPEIAERLYCDQYLEKEITSKILSDEKVADNASEKLFGIRKKIKKLNEQIREKLNWYVRSGSKYLQDNLVTIRNDRYVIPVKSEHRSEVKGFIHDQSSTGSTLFIEPVEVLELNNQLRIAVGEEASEVQEILYDLSHKISLIADNLAYNVENVCEIDELEAKAIYAYKTKSVMPLLRSDGTINIISGRHPLIDKNKVVPLTVKLGDGYQYLLITGPNTGGKTVTLKMTGLFVLMSMSGIFLPSVGGTEISVFENVFCDIGDEQSIEQSLSTFSSHVKNLVNITENANDKSLVLIDEIGAGTDPDEGSALAQAVIKYLLSFRTNGIITTHYSKLKEFAFVDKRIMNASMDFNPETFEPLYKLNIGTPGSSNAIEISSRLGLSDAITAEANSLMSGEKISFENVLKEAEKVRQASENELARYKELTSKIEQEYVEIEKKSKALTLEREKLMAEARSLSRKVVNEKLDEAEELVDKIKEILEKEEINSGDLIKARTLKNQLENKKYNLSEDDEAPLDLIPLKESDLVEGKEVYVKSLADTGVILNVNLKKHRIVVQVGGMKFTVKENALFNFKRAPENKKRVNVTVKREISSEFKNELNVIGKDRNEALIEVENFIDQAVLHNATTVSIIHGVGFKVLSTAIHAYLKKHPQVKEYRFGRYGEGENGVTIVTLK